jgi:SAM-dependent methyltransferase
LNQRPFYGEYAWAYDLLIDRPVRKECDAIVGWLTERGVHAGATVLDAGCGTGRYATELGRRGFVVHGIDVSAELIASQSSRPRICRPTFRSKWAISGTCRPRSSMPFSAAAS